MQVMKPNGPQLRLKLALLGSIWLCASGIRLWVDTTKLVGLATDYVRLVTEIMSPVTQLVRPGSGEERVLVRRSSSMGTLAGKSRASGFLHGPVTPPEPPTVRVGTFDSRGLR